MTVTVKDYVRAGFATIRRVGWLPIAVLVLHEFCAHVVNLYALWPPVDIPLHLLGGLAIAVFTAGTIQVFSERNLIERPHALVEAALVFGIVCTAAVFWEFAEWTADHTLGTTCQLGLDDTILDLLMGVVGGSLFAVPLLVARLREDGSLSRNASKDRL